MGSRWADEPMEQLGPLQVCSTCRGVYHVRAWHIQSARHRRALGLPVHQARQAGSEIDVYRVLGCVLMVASAVVVAFLFLVLLLSLGGPRP